MPGPRYTICYAPPPESPLGRFGAGVIGYDCFEGAEIPRLPIPGIDPTVLALLTVEPRRYGFHALMMAPFRLGKRGEPDLEAAFSQFARRHLAAPLGPLKVGGIGGFIVLRPAQPHPQIEELAAACVTEFDEFRAPLSPGERERRLAAGLSARQTALLERWGDPHVLDEFRFHMALAGPVPEEQRETIKSHLARAFEPLARDDLEVGSISLMRQADPAAAFRVLTRQRLTGK